MSDLNEIELGQLCQSSIEALRATTGGLRQFPGLLKKIIEYRAWERRVTRGRVIELSSLRELITEKPIRGWGEDPKKIEAVIKYDPEVLVLFRDAMVERPGKRAKADTDIPNNVRNKEVDAGNSRAYTVSRLKKQHPELYQEVVDGKLSANKAAIKAGFRKPPKTAEEKILDLFSKLNDKTKRKVLLEQLANTNDKTRRYIHSQLI